MFKHILFSKETILNSISSLASEMRNSKDFKWDDVMYVCVMNGAVPFFQHLTEQLPSGRCVYIQASSYGDSQTMNPLKVEVDKEIWTYNPSQIFIIDDICDSGTTLYTLYQLFSKEFPNARVDTVTLIDRLGVDRLFDFQPTRSAIETGSKAFFAGFGLDNKGYDRNLPYIYDCTEVSNYHNV
jgi:hypoxanthine phosphoribosyltransferase